MKYFTPELYQQFNSLDVEEAERADEAWDRAEAAYRKQLTKNRKHMPSQVRALAELCLHDAMVVSREEQVQPAGETPLLPELPPFRLPYLWTAVAIVSVTLGKEVISLIYSLSDHTTSMEAPEGWRFSKLQEQWLYDEVDIPKDGRGPFVHRILFSTGITLEIPFVSVIIHKFTMPAVSKVTKQSA
jgi:hypothetical protein